VLEPNIFDIANLERGIVALDNKLTKVLEIMERNIDEFCMNEDEWRDR
jgi:hypothetical protein